MKFVTQYICIVATLFMVSCSNHHTLDKLEEIKVIGNHEPNKALMMLDSLEIDVRGESDYVKHKYDLLRIRLNDKADNIPSSDIMIKQLVEYFGEKGTTLEKQEVYYYAGSVYRDLQDTPHALENFYKSIDYASEDECDSIMLRNTYSNLNYLYYRVQNYKDALGMALKEVEISKRLNNNLVKPFMHLGTAYLTLDSTKQAEVAFDSAYFYIIESEDISSQEETLIHLLNSYSELGKMSKAETCLSHITTNPLKEFAPFPCLAFAQFYESAGKKDSAIIYCKRILDEMPDIYNVYDAAKTLYRLYQATGDIMNANKYANIYMQYSDSLDFGKRQELAATVNNEYQYHLDQKKEMDLKDEKDAFKRALIIVSFLALSLIFIGYIINIRRRNKHLQEIIKLSAELQQISDNDEQLREDITKKEKELEKSSNELQNIKHELQMVNEELSEYDRALKDKEHELTEKIEQNKAVISMLHQSELEENAEDVIHDIRQSSSGKKEMTSADWKKLYQAVDQLYPTFKDTLLRELGTFTDQQMQVCYLIKIGLSKPQIQNITNLSRATIWRWVKKYDWIHEVAPK